MSTQTNVITLEQLAQDFTSLFKRRVFRLEALDYYDAPNESGPYARFLAGEPIDPAWREPWKKLVREVRESGRTMQRVKIVSEPVSDYVRFSLLHASPASVEAGEDIRILGRAVAGRAGLGLGGYCDFWLFDDDLAAFLDYDSNGRIEAVQLMDNRIVLAEMRRRRDESLRLATSLARYVNRHNITGRKHAA